MIQVFKPIAVPAFAYVHYRDQQWWWISDEGVIESTDVSTLRQHIQGGQVLICVHGQIMARRLNVAADRLLDIAQLWLLALPNIAMPNSIGDQLRVLTAATEVVDTAIVELEALPKLVRKLMQRIADLREDDAVQRLVAFLDAAGWSFAPAVAQNLGLDAAALVGLAQDQAALAVHQDLPKWYDEPISNGDLGRGITPVEATQQLAAMLPEMPELRQGQLEYAQAVARAFVGHGGVQEYAQVHLLEAGTGIGKTLGYLAPAQLWAERNAEPVWISTYSRHLQDQIITEAQQHLPKDDVVVLKGRENYLCLLNYDELIRGTMAMSSEERIVLGLLARWVMGTQQGIMMGGDFPAWLEENAAPRLMQQLRLKQGECLFSACPFYQQCFIESNNRRAEWAKLVVANHALTLRLVMQDKLPFSRVILDEAHQLFDATDSATRLRFGVYESLDLGCWMLGSEQGNRRRQRRGLWRRIQNLALEEDCFEAVQAVIRAARVLPQHDGVGERIREGVGQNECEVFFSALYQFVHGLPEVSAGQYALELALGEEWDETLMSAAQDVFVALQRLQKAIDNLIKQLKTVYIEAEKPEQIISLLNSLEDYPLAQLKGWCYLLEKLVQQSGQQSGESSTEPDSDFSVLERVYYHPSGTRRELDLGLEMIFRDPTEILPHWLFSSPRAHVVMTSASLGLDLPGQQADGQAYKTSGQQHFAYLRTGVGYIAEQQPPFQAMFPSPYDYANQAQALLITDIDPKTPKAVYAAMSGLLQASGGGGLLLFTAIQRARACYQLLLPQEQKFGRTLYSQHDDNWGNRALAVAMQQDHDASLIATDAFRDGVDIPGESLRLVVLERLPWARPELIHKARVQYFGRDYNHHIVEQRVIQAFGRLIRRRDDWGTFVLLGKSIPSNIVERLPIAMQRVTLDQAQQSIRQQCESLRQRIHEASKLVNKGKEQNQKRDSNDYTGHDGDAL